MTQENAQVDEQIVTTTDQYKEYQSQIEVCLFYYYKKNTTNIFYILATSYSI